MAPGLAPDAHLGGLALHVQKKIMCKNQKSEIRRSGEKRERSFKGLNKWRGEGKILIQEYPEDLEEELVEEMVHFASIIKGLVDKDIRDRYVLATD